MLIIVTFASFTNVFTKIKTNSNPEMNMNELCVWIVGHLYFSLWCVKRDTQVSKNSCTKTHSPIVHRISTILSRWGPITHHLLCFRSDEKTELRCSGLRPRCTSGPLNTLHTNVWGKRSVRRHRSLWSANYIDSVERPFPPQATLSAFRLSLFTDLCGCPLLRSHLMHLCFKLWWHPLYSHTTLNWHSS